MLLVISWTYIYNQCIIVVQFKNYGHLGRYKLIIACLQERP